MRLASHAAISFCVTSHVHIPPRLFVLAFMTQRCGTAWEDGTSQFFLHCSHPATRVVGLKSVSGGDLLGVGVAYRALNRPIATCC